jgi:hypothetical protein
MATRTTSERKSWYVWRQRRDPSRPEGYSEGWVGPIRSVAQAEREAAAWAESGWHSRVLMGTPQIREAVRAWQRAADERLRRTHRTGPSSYGQLRRKRGHAASPHRHSHGRR